MYDVEYTLSTTPKYVPLLHLLCAFIIQNACKHTLCAFSMIIAFIARARCCKQYA